MRLGRDARGDFIEVTRVDPPIEVEGVNWRYSFYRQFTENRKQILLERAKNSSATYECDGQIWRAAVLDDEEVDRVARTYARRITEQAIREQDSDEIQDRVKHRKGEAL